MTSRLRGVLILALASMTSGCLITDPIIPIETATNAAPEFLPGRPQPNPDSPLSYPVGSTQLISFDASARDTETPVDQLVYLWTLDGTNVQGPSPDAINYNTTPSAIGAGTHHLHVRITDTGTPQGILETEWTIVVQ